MKMYLTQFLTNEFFTEETKLVDEVSLFHKTLQMCASPLVENLMQKSRDENYENIFENFKSKLRFELFETIKLNYSLI